MGLIQSILLHFWANVIFCISPLYFVLSNQATVSPNFRVRNSNNRLESVPLPVGQIIYHSKVGSFFLLLSEHSPLLLFLKMSVALLGTSSHSVGTSMDTFQPIFVWTPNSITSLTPELVCTLLLFVLLGP